MPTYYFTFGQKYRTQKHPRGAHPDGWWEIEAPDEMLARTAMIQECGLRWAFCYRLPPPKSLHPRGCLKRLVYNAAMDN